MLACPEKNTADFTTGSRHRKQALSQSSSQRIKALAVRLCAQRRVEKTGGSTKPHRRKIAAVTGNQVNVHMRHMLVRRRTVIHDEIGAILMQADRALRRNDTTSHAKEMVAKLFRQLIEQRGMPAWYDQYVPFVQWKNVHERDAVLVFPDKTRGHGAALDPAKNAVAHAKSLSR